MCMIGLHTLVTLQALNVHDRPADLDCISGNSGCTTVLQPSLALHNRQYHKTPHHGFTEPKNLTSDKAFMALNISMATSTDKDRVEALALPYVK